jgi:hypothetical protein
MGLNVRRELGIQTNTGLDQHLNSASRNCRRLTARVRVIYLTAFPAFPYNNHKSYRTCCEILLHF